VRLFVPRTTGETSPIDAEFAPRTVSPSIRGESIEMYFGSEMIFSISVFSSPVVRIF
jgi:hypothetical protein